MYGIFTQMFHKMYRQFGVDIEYIDPMGFHAVLPLISWDSLSDGNFSGRAKTLFRSKCWAYILRGAEIQLFTTGNT